MHVETPYAPPRTEPIEVGPLTDPVLRRRARRAMAMALAPLLGVGFEVLAALSEIEALLIAGLVVLAITFAVGAVGGVQGWRALRAMVRDEGLGSTGTMAVATGAGILGSLAGLLAAGWAAIIVLMAVGGFSRGRQVRRFGRPVFAPLEAQPDWIDLSGTPGTPQAAAAAAWRQNGLTEHASVAAFAALSLELVELGAPPALLEGASSDAIDEIRHAQLCFSLANALDGQAISPGAFPPRAAYQPSRLPRSFRLAKLAVTSLLDGAIHEGLSARALAELLRGELDPQVRPVIESIVADEARHAAHGFQVVRWCLKEGGRPVALALEAALDRLPETLDLSEHPEISELMGLPTPARLTRVYEDVKARTVARTRRILAA